MRTFWVLLLMTGMAYAQDFEWRLEIPSAWVLSSPRLADLNQDGIRDVVIGGGGEDQPMENGILAIDGDSGKLLWKVFVRDQVYGSALFYDLNKDGTQDVFICGRGAVLMSINGKNGEILWEFWSDSMGKARDFGWYNFYQAQFVEDINGDQVPDLLCSNGGDNKAGTSNRPIGNLVIISGADGALLKIAAMPDGRETYFAPMLYEENGSKRIIFGSGGESHGGSLWEVDYADFLQGGLSNARAILTDSLRGFIAHPSWADLNGDGQNDLIVPQHNGILWAIDLLGDQVLWKKEFPAYQIYAAPTVGQFVGDPTPDVYITLAEGVFSFYADYVPIVVDGQTGEIAWSDSSEYIYQLSQANALDWDQDGVDEVLRLHNQDAIKVGRLYFNEFEIVDFNDQVTIQLGTDRPGLNVFSTPYITNLDGDANLDVLFAYTPDIDQWAGNNGSRLERVELPITVAETDIAWNAYLGNLGNGVYAPGVLSRSEELGQEQIWIYPNPVEDQIFLKGFQPGDRLKVRDLAGRLLLEVEAKPAVWLGGLEAGIYVVELGASRRRMVKI
ncbi:MAG: T9SS type A sorting domain-containing protein [Bacteroidia bacterium]|nr:T9SS type A sorting domain-containing protein [Bacteroidia bacterium]